MSKELVIIICISFFCISIIIYKIYKKYTVRNNSNSVNRSNHISGIEEKYNSSSESEDPIEYTKYPKYRDTEYTGYAKYPKYRDKKDDPEIDEIGVSPIDDKTYTSMANEYLFGSDTHKYENELSKYTNKLIFSSVYDPYEEDPAITVEYGPISSESD